MASLRNLISLLVLLACIASACGYIHNLSISKDSRKHFFIENFGFEQGGTIEIRVTGFSLNPPLPNGKAPKVGFLIKKSETDSTRYLEENGQIECLLDDAAEIDQIVTPNNWDEWTYKIPRGGAGFYNTYFVNCVPDTTVTFHLDFEQYNRGHSYLPSGLAPLPLVYAFFFIVFAMATAYWVWVFFFPEEGYRVFAIHYLMTILITVKTVALLSKAIEYHDLEEQGHPGGWAIIYFIFAALKGIMLFVVIALIGTGWTFIKGHLSDRDKKIFLLVIPLQIINNIALVILDETAPGSMDWFTWQNIFKLVDLVCCGAIIVPIMWSIKHLKEASTIDGKAAQNLQKLKLFRQFYLEVASYIYFTRIIIFLVDATLPFRWVWIGALATEAATFLFFVVVGYQFRPISDNPFLKLDSDEEDDVELAPMGDNGGVTERKTTVISAQETG